ncbi:uncharacterized protein LY89DRAFT_789792 [Mollisia scopiformis]|uniref:Uncharacterized protein n=1 Tax=Mollisia scopiformis TaxID=149040 RepID=A0A132B617_MOLSC|nr:uncharacterized protein LY89DRAFT_789792 [Mollisia scopiformis]KUJ07334.1 hypothetical protein LY89DRAFT_789792 [Mollisia scopiformis]
MSEQPAAGPPAALLQVVVADPTANQPAAVARQPVAHQTGISVIRIGGNNIHLDTESVGIICVIIFGIVVVLALISLAIFG